MVCVELSQNGQYKNPRFQIDVDNYSEALPPSINSPQSRNEIWAPKVRIRHAFSYGNIILFDAWIPGPVFTSLLNPEHNQVIYIVLISTCLSSVLGARAGGKEWRGASREVPFTFLGGAAKRLVRSRL